MSTLICSAIATCTIAGLDDSKTAALAVYDYLANHPDEIPVALDDLDSDECVETISRYLQIQGNHLVIGYDTEADCYDSEVFDFLARHFACLQTSPFMEVNWSNYDSKRGASSRSDYYDRSGALIDVRAILTAHLTGAAPAAAAPAH